MTNYFVGNSKGLAKYFVKQCNYDASLQMVEIMAAAPAYNGALQTAAQASKMQVFA